MIGCPERPFFSFSQFFNHLGTHLEKCPTLDIRCSCTSVSLPRERFWDIPVTKVDSPTRQPMGARAVPVTDPTPKHRKLAASYGADSRDDWTPCPEAISGSPLALRTTGIQHRSQGYRGLLAPAFALHGRKRMFSPMGADEW
jgi:hypothetical protein